MYQMVWQELVFILFQKEKKYVLSKNIRQQENVVTIKVILNLWQCFVPFVFIACQGTWQK